MGRGRLPCRILASTCSWFILILPIFGSALAAAPSTGPLFATSRITVGIVRDGPSADLDAFIRQVEQELQAITGTEYLVRFKQPDSFAAGWSQAGAKKALRSAINDGSVDFVFAAGVLVAQAANSRNLPLAKPVIAGSIFDADLLGLSSNSRNRSSKAGFNFIFIPDLSIRHFKALQQLIRFKILHILVDSKIIAASRGLKPKLAQLEKELGCRIRITAMDRSADRVLDQLPEETEAVYLTPAFRMSAAEQQKLIDGINARNIPSFSLLGYADVRRGVLAALAPIQTGPLARRVALHLRQLMDGMSPNELPVTMTMEEQLVINARTAAAIGYHPTLDVKLQAEFIDQRAAEGGERLSLARCMKIAVTNNVDLAIQKDQVDIALQDQNRAKSYLLPQLGGNTRYLQIDRDSAEASFGSQPENQTTIGFQAQQMLYDDRLVSNYRASRKLYQGSQFDAETVQFDVMEQAALRYLDYLAALALVQIEQDNLKLTRSNLDLARVRARVGIAGPQEVYRWEANVAGQKASVLTAKSNEEQARVALNRVMGVDQRLRWQTEDLEVPDDQLYFLDRRMKPLLRTTAQLESFRRFAVELAFENQSSLKSVQQAIEAQQIVLGQQKRRFILPSFNTGFQFDHRLNDKTVTPFSGSSLAGNRLPSDFGSLTDDDQWAWSVSASLPLFEGGRRFYDVARTKADIRRLRNSRLRLQQLIEQSVQSALYGLESSQPGVRLARRSEQSALKNLEVVQDQYARGTVPIITVLDAQNRAFRAAQQSVIAVFSYLRDLMTFQRSIAWFESTKTEQERQELVRRFQAFLHR